MDVRFNNYIMLLKIDCHIKFKEFIEQYRFTLLQMIFNIYETDENDLITIEKYYDIDDYNTDLKIIEDIEKFDYNINEDDADFTILESKIQEFNFKNSIKHYGYLQYAVTYHIYKNDTLYCDNMLCIRPETDDYKRVVTIVSPLKINGRSNAYSISTF